MCVRMPPPPLLANLRSPHSRSPPVWPRARQLLTDSLVTRPHVQRRSSLEQIIRHALAHDAKAYKTAWRNSRGGGRRQRHKKQNMTKAAQHNARGPPTDLALIFPFVTLTTGNRHIWHFSFGWQAIASMSVEHGTRVTPNATVELFLGIQGGERSMCGEKFLQRMTYCIFLNTYTP